MYAFCFFSVLVLLVIIVVVSWTRAHDDFPRARPDNEQQIMEEIILLERLEEEERE